MPHRILLIEDSPTQLLSIKKVLEAEGHEVTAARQGAEGLARAYNESPDLIISDVVMSGVNGYQVCRLVKSDPELNSTPVVLLTRLDGSVDRFWGLKSGADRYIPKEPGFQSLLKAVREILSDVRPRLRSLEISDSGPSNEEINSRLNQLLERLLFEATIAEEVRKIADDIADIEVIGEKLFELLGSIFDYQAAGLMVNHGTYSEIRSDLAKPSLEEPVHAFIARIGLQLGLAATTEEMPRSSQTFDSAITQPVDSFGVRLGLLVIVPPSGKNFKPGDQKVIRLICDELCTVLRLHLSYVHREAAALTGG